MTALRKLWTASHHVNETDFADKFIREAILNYQLVRQHLLLDVKRNAVAAHLYGLTADREKLDR
jgi:hypothetical protein